MSISLQIAERLTRSLFLFIYHTDTRSIEWATPPGSRNEVNESLDTAPASSRTPSNQKPGLTGPTGALPAG